MENLKPCSYAWNYSLPNVLATELMENAAIFKLFPNNPLFLWIYVSILVVINIFFLKV